MSYNNTNQQQTTGFFSNAYNYTTQTAHNLGVKIGIVSPSPAETIREAGAILGDTSGPYTAWTPVTEPTMTEVIKNSTYRDSLPENRYANTGYTDKNIAYHGTEPMPGKSYANTGLTDPAVEKMKDTAHTVGVKMGVANPTPAEKARQEAHKLGVKTGVEDPTMGERLYGTMENVGEKAKEKAHQAGVKMGVVAPTTGEKIYGTMENVGEKAKEKAHQAGVKMGVAEPTLGEKVSETAHKAGVKMGVVEPTLGEKVKGTMDYAGDRAKEKAELAKVKAWESKEVAKLNAQQEMAKINAQQAGGKGVDTRNYEPTISKTIE
jgi:hypothetical protein